MIDWKKFEDEVPTEPRSVLCGSWQDDMVSLEPYPFVDGVWVANDEVFGHGTEEWHGEAAAREMTHWAYIDPPEDA